MKILRYNWVNYDDEKGQGGGVRIYQNNLVAEPTREPKNRVYTLSSGIGYDLFNRRVYLRERSRRNGVASYEVVNSPVGAPAHAIFYSLDAYLHDSGLQRQIGDFLEAHGPFDVVQFDNLEALSASVLELKKRFPTTRFIYYMHSYNLLCPQVNLRFAESVSCDDYNQGKRCSACLPHVIDLRAVKIAHAVAGLLKRLGVKPQSLAFRMSYRHLAFTKWVLVASFVGFLARAAAIRRVGLPDARFFLAYDDTELSLRLKRAGYKLWLLPGSRVDHRRALDTRLRHGPLGPKHDYNLRNRLIVYREFGERAPAWRLLAPLAEGLLLFLAAGRGRPEAFRWWRKAMSDSRGEPYVLGTEAIGPSRRPKPNGHPSADNTVDADSLA